jgi:cell fate regulator YaaT (PSP1 superfamily)
MLAKVCLGPANKCCLVDPGPAELKLGDRVVVEIDNTPRLGRVMGIFPELDPQLVFGQVRSLLRLASPQDLAQEEKNRQLEKRALDFCQRRISDHKLPIYLVQVEFRTRIELRQIGVRHRAKMVGGLGICGRGLCCASFLRDFEPVSVRMAKEQQLSLNPNKISGICGRLMCCLTYEYASYQEIRKSLPRVGKRLRVPEGEGKIIRYNLIRSTITLEMEDKRELEIPLADLAELLATESTPESG